MPEQTGKKPETGNETNAWRKKYQRLEENIPGMVYSVLVTHDHRYRFSYVSQASLDLLGISPEQLMADSGHFLRLIHPADRERFEQSLASHAVTSSPWREELRLVINGHVRWYDSMARPESLTDGSVCWHGLLLDITARKEAEKNQFRTNSLLDAIFTQNPYPIWISDRYGSLIRMNRACKPILERFQDGVVGIYNILLDGRIRDQGFLSLVRSVFDEGNTAEFLLELGERAEPEQYPSVFEVTVAPVRDEQGMVTNAIVMYKDITEQKRVEADLRLTQFCIDQAGLGIFRIEEPDGRVVFANHRACKSLGYTMEELCSMTVFDFDPNFTRQNWLEHRRNVRSRKNATIETMHRRKDGTMFPVEVSITYLEYEGKTYSYSFAIDITERKKAEARLREAAGPSR